ncbi:MAG: hypothetical protein WBX15_12935 [Thermoanaerobaculia bacterium]
MRDRARPAAKTACRSISLTLIEVLLAAGILSAIACGAGAGSSSVPESPAGQPETTARPAPPSTTTAPVQSSAPATATSTETPPDEVEQTVRAFGRKLAKVSLLAPPETLRTSIRKEYGALVTPDLLNRWITDPGEAPGRLTSSPWPDHIDILRTDRNRSGADRTLLFGDVVEVSSAGGGAPVDRVPVAIELDHTGDGWKISGWWSSAPRTPSGGDALGAAAVVESYYAAIGRGDYETAYHDWGNSGQASGKTLDQFRSGFASTARTAVVTGPPGRVEGAAGSRYVGIPVEITATTKEGETQHFRGSYTMRRTVIEGSTPAQRRWHITTAKISRKE